jgi:hypothetical protein
MKLFKHYIIFCLLSFVSLGICCNKKFDEPPAFAGPDVQPNLSIRDMRAMHFNGNFEHFADDFIIEGIIVADDSNDNFYKSITLQDSTGGITILMDEFGLYTDYPVGRRLAVKLKGLWMGDYAKMIQLGGSVDRSDPAFPGIAPIPVPLFDRFLVKKSLNNPVVPKIVRLDQLNDSLQSCLIRIDNLEFSVADTGKPYADAINKLSSNTTVKACSGGSVYIRTSGFANFASAKVPRGNGSITAIYSVFRTEKQLMLRDTSDVRLNGLRCTAPGYKILFEEDFENASSNADLLIAGWKNITESGSKSFQVKTANHNSYAEISGFATNQPSIISWLIMPPVNLNNSANEILSFQTKDGFDNGGVLQVFASANYDGGNNPAKAKWTLLKTFISKGSVSGFAPDWVLSGDISLASFSGTVYIAFRYDGADPAAVFDKRTTTFQLDNVRIEGN